MLVGSGRRVTQVGISVTDDDVASATAGRDEESACGEERDKQCRAGSAEPEQTEGEKAEREVGATAGVVLRCRGDRRDRIDRRYQGLG